MAACSVDYKIKLFDISELPDKSPQMIQDLEPMHTDFINTLSFSSDNMLLASAGNDK